MKEIKNIRCVCMMMIAWLIIFVTMVSCNEKKKVEAPIGSYYTCSMDPQVVSDHDGICPVCRMQLILVSRNTLRPGELRLSDQQFKLANIRFDTVKLREIGEELNFPGKLINDPSKNRVISARAEGRIERTYIKNEGDPVMKGQLLYEIFSEEINDAQREFLLSQDLNAEYNLASPAGKKLLLLGVDEATVKKIAAQKKVITDIPVYSPSEGYITEIDAREGDYVTEGGAVFKISSARDLWVEIHIAPSQLDLISIGSTAKMIFPGNEALNAAANVEFIEPEVHAPARYVLVRLKPVKEIEGANAFSPVSISMQVNQKKAMAVSSSSLLRDAHGATAWVFRDDGIFEVRAVNTGMEGTDYTEIKEGLREGEVVASNGAYLIQSEYFFKRQTNQ
jgi:Cu(I)/Ag(I) efflux system membrane fusion protein